ncbi:MAG: 16S rRNA (adenine(1518)-N(6)/adenine(1519)-N(6))-dimethyltransferase RsmA [Verrucomicrobiales bacterium]|nr:16S rRNA (adenine(1518)-N(6)/adenine(1519)-N(6))-dimethyltransferase RsmA [Verrucomicrobiales bacterium]
MSDQLLRKTLRAIDVVPSRELGQNFLVDEEFSKWIVDQLDPQPEDVIVEIGPGTGALSRHLVGRCRKLILIEKDRRLAEFLRGEFVDSSEVEVIHADAITYDKRPLFLEGPIKLIGNLPYSAATPIMRNFLEQPTPVVRAVLMLQKEVAERLVAVPSTKAYGKLGLRVQAEWHVDLVRTAGPECFHPRPKVDSSIVVLQARQAGELSYFSKRLFDDLTNRGFAQRRKLLKKNLSLKAEEWSGLVSRLQCSDSARAEELSLPQWVELCNARDDHPVLDLPEDSSAEIFDVVDEQDQVLRQATRAEVHSEGWRHRAVHIFVLDKKGNLYLQKRSALKDRHAGQWDSSAAGHLDAGETYEAAAQRELYEELMVKARSVDGGEALQEIARIEACEQTGWEFVRLYSCEVSGKIRTHGREIECGAYFPMELVRQWVDKRPQDFAPGFIECLRRFDSNDD